MSTGSNIIISYEPRPEIWFTDGWYAFYYLDLF